MPVALQYLTLLVPARYFVSLSKALFLKGISPLLLWWEVAALAAVLAVLGVLLLRRAGSLGLRS
jgi:ABC-2 type transport system permease protein